MIFFLLKLIFIALLSSAHADLLQTRRPDLIKSVDIIGSMHSQVAYARAKEHESSAESMDSSKSNSWHGPEIRRFRLGFIVNSFQNVSARVEGIFVPNDDKEFQMQFAYVDWSKYDFFNLRFGYDRAKFVFEENTSSGQILAIERSHLTNLSNIGYHNGLSFYGQISDLFDYNLAVLTNTSNRNPKGENPRYIHVVSFGLEFGDYLSSLDKLRLELDLVHNDQKTTGVTDRKRGIAFAQHFIVGSFDWRSEYIWTEGLDQNFLRGFYLQPAYSISDENQIVVRYESMNAQSIGGITTSSRYQNQIGELGGTYENGGERFDALYLGHNHYFSGHAHKLMLGLEFSRLRSEESRDVYGTTAMASWRFVF